MSMAARLIGGAGCEVHVGKVTEERTITVSGETGTIKENPMWGTITP